MTKYDLEDRLLEFAVRVVRVTESMHRSRAGTHVADQLLRAGTSPDGNHGEAEGAESRQDFVHKLKVCYKELREARRWLRLVERTPLVEKPALLADILKEADELIRIFAASIRTAQANHAPARQNLSVKRSALSVERLATSSAP
ncbi:MAG: four helix bundle protein [Opitutaceae bacterium]|nr:four helix bundle protein [Opitutaceae bacterium]